MIYVLIICIHHLNYLVGDGDIGGTMSHEGYHKITSKYSRCKKTALHR